MDHWQQVEGVGFICSQFQLPCYLEQIPSVTARSSVGPMTSSRAWKTGVEILARNEVPTRPGRATSYVSPDVAGRSRSRVYSGVKETASSGRPHSLDFLIGVIRAECSPFTNQPFPYTNDRKHTNQWWYVPTAEEPVPGQTYYVLQVPGE